jgi:hypothetical protein
VSDQQEQDAAVRPVIRLLNGHFRHQLVDVDETERAAIIPSDVGRQTPRAVRTLIVKEAEARRSPPGIQRGVLANG